MNQKSTKLASLASDMVEALPPQETDLRLYVSDLGMFYAGQLTTEQCSAKPDQCPYYGPVFAAALQAVENGWESRAEHHAERFAKVKRVGGYLPQVKRIERRTGGNPQPTDRRDFDNGYTPRTGKE